MVFQWKMSFNPDHSKQAQEVIFSHKLKKSAYLPLHFTNIAVTQSTTQKYLSMILDVKLDFQGHLKNIYSKVNKTIGLLRKLHNTLPRLLLLYDQAYTASFHQKIESAQYNSALAITDTIRGTSKEKLYHELGLESLEKEDGTGNRAAFIKYSETNLQNIYSILFLLL